MSQVGQDPRIVESEVEQSHRLLLHSLQEFAKGLNPVSASLVNAKIKAAQDYADGVAQVTPKSVAETLGVAEGLVAVIRAKADRSSEMQITASKLSRLAQNLSDHFDQLRARAKQDIVDELLTNVGQNNLQPIRKDDDLLRIA